MSDVIDEATDAAEDAADEVTGRVTDVVEDPPTNDLPDSIGGAVDQGADRVIDDRTDGSRPGSKSARTTVNDVYTDRDRLREPVRTDATNRKQFRDQLRSEFANRFSAATVSDLTFDESDIRLSETREGVRPQLTRSARREIAAEQFGVGTDDVQLTEGGGATLTERAQREQAAEQARDDLYNDVQQVDGQPMLVGEDLSETRMRAAAVGIGADDVELTDDGAELTPDVQREVAAARAGVPQDAINIDDGRPSVSGEYQREQAAESLEEQLQSEFTGRTEFDPARPGQNAPPNEAREVDLSPDDVRQAGDGFKLTDAAQRRVSEIGVSVAREQFDQQLPIDVSRDDLTREGGRVTLSAEGREELQDFQASAAREELLQDLRSETGADLSRDDIRVDTTRDDGESSYRAELTDSGRRELAGEQVPGSDLPYIGDTLESGGEVAEGINQRRRDIGDEIADRAPNVPSPSAEEVAAASAVGVATPEPVSTGAGTVALGTLALAGLGASAIQRTDIGSGPGQRRASTNVGSQSDVVSSTEVGLGSGISTTELGIGGVTSTTQVGLGGRTSTTELGIGDVTSTTQIGTPNPQEMRDPRTMQTTGQAVIGQQVEDDADTIGGDDIVTPEDLVEPDRVPPSNRERQRRDDLSPFERRFPTGSSSVVGEEAGTGRGLRRLDDVTEPDVTVEDQGLSTSTGPIGRSELLPLTGTDVGPKTGIKAGARAAQREQGLLESLINADAVSDAVATQTALEAANPSVPGLQYPTLAPEPFEYQSEVGYGFPTTDTPSRPRAVRSDRDEGDDLGDLSTGFGEASDSDPTAGWFGEFTAARAGVSRGAPENLEQLNEEIILQAGGGLVEGQVGPEAEQERFNIAAALYEASDAEVFDADNDSNRRLL